MASNDFREKEEKDIRPAEVTVGAPDDGAVDPLSKHDIRTGMAVVGQGHTIPQGYGSNKTTTRLEYWTYCLYGELALCAELIRRLGWHWRWDRELRIRAAAEPP